MKNIYEILTALGIEVPADKKADFDKEVAANYKTVAEVEKKDTKITALEGQLQTVKEGMKAFEGVDVADLRGQISTLTNSLATKETEYQSKLADMEFDGLLAGAVSTAKGKNAKAIRALLDVDALKASKNQAQDIQTALDGLKKESAYLFDTEAAPSPYAAGTGTQPPAGQAFGFDFTGVRPHTNSEK